MRALFRVLLVSPGTTGDSGNTPSICPNLVKHQVCKLKNCPEDNPSPVQIMSEFVKKWQCKKATRIPKFNSFSDQRWKLDGNMLENKAGIWKSVDSWVFKSKNGGLIYIENTSTTKVLGAKSDGKVIQEFLVEGKADQLWKKGKPDAEGYFILYSFLFFGLTKVLTAISENSLEIKGNITMRWIFLVDYLLIIYHVFFLHIDQIKPHAHIYGIKPDEPW